MPEQSKLIDGHSRKHPNGKKVSDAGERVLLLLLCDKYKCATSREEKDRAFDNMLAAIARLQGIQTA